MKVITGQVNLFRKLFLLLFILVLGIGAANEAKACICAAPGTVTTNAATSVTMSSFTITWAVPTTSCGGITNYQIDLSVDNFTSSVATYPKATGSTSTTLNLTGLNCGTTYYYRVKGTTCGGNSAAWSAVRSVTTAACVAHCTNGIRDSDETGVDCGGSACVTCCSNGTMDAGETGIDCGGPCTACPPPAIGSCTNPRVLYVGSDCDDTQGTQYDEANNMIQTDGGGLDIGSAMTSSSSSIDGPTNGTNCTGSDLATPSYWVKFNSGSNTSLTFDNTGPSALDYALFTAASNPTSCVAANLTNYTCVEVGSNASLAVAVAANTTYYVQITGADATNIPNAYLCITGATPYVPPYDNCGNALNIATGTNYYLDNSNATVDFNNTLCSGSTENNIWVKWTATFTGTAYVFMQDQDCITTQGMQLSIFEAGATCPSGTTNCEVYVNPNTDNDFSGNFAAVSGSTYYIQVDGYAGTGCSFNFCISNANNADCSILLPISLFYFTATPNNGKVDIRWTTKSESNNDYFTVERSLNAISFDEIARIEGAGNSIKAIDYSYYDMNPYNGIAYYRLKQTDYDGNVSYSNMAVVGIEGSDDELISVVPNPFTENTSIHFNSEAQQETVFIQVYDAVGKSVFTTNYETVKGLNKYRLSTENLDKGIYIITIIKGNKVLKSKMLKK
jgi:hypothetical protein